MKKEELLVITLAIVIFIAIFIIIEPSITGYATYEFSNFTYANNTTVNETIQLKQHSYITANWTTEEIFYSNLIYAEKKEDNESNIIITDELQKLIELNDNQTNLGKDDLLKIKFDNILENNDKINLYLKSNQQSTLNVCTFNAENSCNNQTIFVSLNYPGQEGFYQLVLNLSEPTKNFTLDSVKQAIKIDYINASYLGPVEHINRTYYYNSDSIETQSISPENFGKWDIFTADYILNNQTIKFYYKINNYTEFTPPFNFSSINSPSLKFKIDLLSDNTSTPVIYNLSINYLEIQEPASSGQAPSLTRYKSSLPTITTQQVKEVTKTTETKTVSIPVKIETAPEQEITQVVEVKPNKLKIIGNTIALSYLAFICLILYRRKHKL